MATPPLVQRKASLPIHFFKTILESNVEWMKIPNKFTRRYGGGLSNPVFLRPPDSKEWEVHWTKENGEVWFQKGWKEFVEYYSLEHGHFVLFKYNGTSLIDVLILDRSAIEIDDEMGTVDPNVEKLHADKGVRSDHHQTKVRVRPRSPLVSSEPRNKMPSGSEKAIERTSSLNTPKLLRAKKVARNFVSNNVFFTVVIARPQLEEGAWVWFNIELIKVIKVVPKFLDMERKKQNVMLQIENRMWPVKLTNGGGDMQYDRFTSGWSLFAKESKLQAGDICIFELIDPDGPTLEVHITKAR
ncbi:hypothetical protein GLYMA_20G108300v4 [Glycine max]|uniref:TF-B3 domain-containing protein n=1 Tax=Glycine max TaxID=3847 RepID=A0A0R0EIL9_SOYBN|nr:hypothetical protein GYH30_055488 [Glycine max]KRG90690.1 hypothetical protein GLYMA_20G108300v4 [Glycine max]